MSDPKTIQKGSRLRSNSFTINIPPRIEDLDDTDHSHEFVDVRDEIMLIKDQFDRLLSVLDDGLLGPTLNSITK